MMDILIERAGIKDAAEILALQRRAYQSEAKIYGDYDIPPLTQTLAEMRADLDKLMVLKALFEERIVGSVRARLIERTCHVGRLIVDPKFQNRGIGTRLLDEIEARFAGAARFELFTGHLSARNLYLYHKLGYREFQRQDVSPALTLVYLEKHKGQISSRDRSESAQEISRQGGI
jgi:ribosomal protein S18 acetylase RimI-like enzyme